MTFICLIAITQAVYSQDLLVTTTGDSLKCKILKVNKNAIYYAYMKDGVIRDTLSRQSIKEYKFDLFAINDTLEGLANLSRNFSKYRVAFNYGMGNLLAPLSDDTPENLVDYLMNLKSGGLVGGDIAYYFSSHLGIGLKFSQFNTANSKYPIYEIDERTGITLRTGSMRDEISIVYVGPTFSTRVPSIYRNDAFFMNFSLGYMGYTNDKVVFDEYMLQGKTMGFAWDLGYDISFSKNVAVGVQLSLHLGHLSEYVMTDNLGTRTIKLGKEQYESLDRLDLTIGLRFMHE